MHISIIALTTSFYPKHILVPPPLPSFSIWYLHIISKMKVFRIVFKFSFHHRHRFRISLFKYERVITLKIYMMTIE